MIRKLIPFFCLLPLFSFAYPSADGFAEREPPTEEKHQLMLEMVQNRQFVLQSHTLYSRRGQTAFVSPVTNFIAVDGDNAVIQLAFDNASPGFNGLGGITLEGLG